MYVPSDPCLTLNHKQMRSKILEEKVRHELDVHAANTILRRNLKLIA